MCPSSALAALLRPCESFVSYHICFPAPAFMLMMISLLLHMDPDTLPSLWRSFLSSVVQIPALHICHVLLLFCLVLGYVNPSGV